MIVRVQIEDERFSPTAIIEQGAIYRTFVAFGGTKYGRQRCNDHSIWPSKRTNDGIAIAAIARPRQPIFVDEVRPDYDCHKDNEKKTEK